VEEGREGTLLSGGKFVGWGIVRSPIVLVLVLVLDLFVRNASRFTSPAAAPRSKPVAKISPPGKDR
jgi:hypothetical protein